MQLFRTRTFKKDYQKIQMSDGQYKKYIEYLSLLLKGKSLPQEARDHNLVGNLKGFREFHVGGDLLIVYCVEDEILRLTRIGTHAQLFD